MKKKMFGLSLLICTLLAFVGCNLEDEFGNSNQNPNSNTSDDSKEKLPEILLSDDGFKYAISRNAVEIYGLSEYDKVKLVIPAEINGLPVTEIAEGAFSSVKNIVAVEFPSSLKKIGAAAFQYSGLKGELVISEGVQHIGEGAFSNLNISKVTIPSTLKSGGTDIFYGCENLSEIVLTDGLAFCPGFSACKKITEITIPDSVTEIGSLSGCSITEIKLPANLKKLDGSALVNLRISGSLILPDGVEEIGDWAFAESDFEEIYIPSSVKKLGTRLFASCNNLKKITIACDLSDEVCACDKNNGPFLGMYGHSQEKEVESEYGGTYTTTVYDGVDIVFEDTVKTVTELLLKDCNPKTIDFGGVEEIADNACKFEADTVILSKNLKKVGKDNEITANHVVVQSDFEHDGKTLFTAPYKKGYDKYGNSCEIYDDGCTVKFSDDITSIPSYFCKGYTVNSDAEMITLKQVGEFAFYDCEVNIPITIGKGEGTSGSFVACNFTKTVYMPYDNDTNKVDFCHYGAKESRLSKVVIGNLNCLECNYNLCLSGIDEVVFTDNVPDLILQSTDVKKVVLSANTTRIGRRAFRNAETLTTIEGMENVTSIGDYAFENCENLEKFTLGKNPVIVLSYAFRNCKNAEFEFKAPVILKGEGKSAYSFENCTKLNAITVRGNFEKEDLLKYIFKGCTALTEDNLIIEN